MLSGSDFETWTEFLPRTRASLARFSAIRQPRIAEPRASGHVSFAAIPPLFVLPKELLDSAHGQEEPFLYFRQFNKTVLPVECSR